jgi:hypothetical protein
MRVAAMMTAMRLALVGALMVPLGGCGSETASMALFGVSGGALMMTKKTLTDHAVSAVLQEDCSVIKMEQDGYYCRPKVEPVAIEEPTLYCYQTLADVDCYAKPDPHQNKDTLVGIRPGSKQE